MENRIHFLLKLGQRCHLESLRSKGNLYFNTIDYFRKIEGDNQRNDSKEGNEGHYRIDDAGFLNEAFDLISFRELFPGFSHATWEYQNLELKGNIYSMLALTTELMTNTDRIDPQNMDFGDSFLFIQNPNKFLNMVIQAFLKSGRKLKFDLVSYYDPKTYNGQLNIFHKPKAFSHQNEFRILSINENNEPLSIQIGNIEKISSIHDISELPKFRFDQHRVYIQEK